MIKDIKKARLASSMAQKQLETCEKFKQARLSKIQEMEEAYYGKVRPILKGRSNIPIPILAEYVDEIKSRLDENPTLKFSHKRNSQILVAKKVQAAIELDSSPARGDYARKDRMQRTLAIFSGLGIYDYYAESYPDYKACLDIVDLADFFFEPTGGSDLEDHSFVGKANIFRTIEYLEDMAAEGTYDKKQVERLKTKTGTDDYKKIQTTFLNRYDRYKALGVDMNNNQFIGQNFVSLAQWEMEIGSERYFLVFDQLTGEPLRFEPLKDVFKSNLYSFTLWQTHEDPHNVLSKSPCDDIYPIAETYRLKLNQLIDNSTKRIWGQRAFDPNFFPDPSQLEWNRPDQLIIAKSYQGKPISQGVYEFKTEDATVGTIDLLRHLDGLLSRISGVSPQDSTQDNQKVGVLFGNLQKVAARLGGYNKSYNECWQKLGLRMVWGLKEHMTEPMMVKTIGERGVEWEELRSNELDHKPDFDISVVGSNVELEMSEAVKKKQSDALMLLAKDPEFKKEMNPKALVEEMLRIGQFEEDRIRRIMDTKNYGNEKIIAHAAMAVEAVLKGKEPKMYQGADIAFMNYILDFVRDNNVEMDKFMKLISYGQAHSEIVIRNMTQEASKMLSAAGVPPTAIQPPQTAQNAPGQAMPLPTEQSAISQGLQESNVSQGI